MRQMILNQELITDQTLNIDPDQLRDYLLKHGWDEKINGDVSLWTYGNARHMMPMSRDYGDYENRLLELLLSIQRMRSPSLESIAKDIKDRVL